jgi:hypothetical protein
VPPKLRLRAWCVFSHIVTAMSVSSVLIVHSWNSCSPDFFLARNVFILTRQSSNCQATPYYERIKTFDSPWHLESSSASLIQAWNLAAFGVNAVRRLRQDKNILPEQHKQLWLLLLNTGVCRASMLYLLDVRAQLLLSKCVKSQSVYQYSPPPGIFSNI